MRCAPLVAALLAACGGRTEIETCDRGGPVPFERPTIDIRCKGPVRELFAIRDEADWSARCAAAPAVDLGRFTLVGYFLEDGCKYSGCASSVPLITDMQREGCRIEVAVRDPDPVELGACHACLQPRDFVLVEHAFADGILVEK